MTEKLNIDKIKKIPREEFKEILKSWMDEKEIKKTLQKKLRQQLVSDFQKTEIAKSIEAQRQKGIIKSRDYVIDTLQAENLYVNNNHFSLSVFFTETRHAALMPHFEKHGKFRFKKNDARELIELLGLTKSDEITEKIISSYEKTSSQSLLSVLLKELIENHTKKVVETRSQATQTDDVIEIETQNESKFIASNKFKGRRNHSLLRENKTLKRKSRDVSTITNILGAMSTNIGTISEKLDDFKDAPSSVDSQAIVGCVGTIMSQLSSVIGNFESLCRDIKQINESKSEKNFENWMDDLQSSENGKRLVKKLQKTFTKVIDDEKSRVKCEYQKKLEREKSKLSKHYNRKTKSLVKDENLDIKELSAKITKEISQIYETTAQKMKNIDDEENEFLRKFENENRTAFTVEKLKISDEKLSSTEINLDECRQIHYDNDESSINSTEDYTSSTFESEDEDD